jgi:hypothetical protein
MNESKICFRNRILLLALGLMALTGVRKVSAQEWRWLRIGELQSLISERGAEVELEMGSGTQNWFSWPAQYGSEQSTVRSKALWLGCRNFYDTVEEKLKAVKVVGIGPREDTNWRNQIFPKKIKLLGRFTRPLVIVDDQPGTILDIYDALDEVDETLPADRMIVVKFNTSIGISVTKRVAAFGQEYHDNYFINEYVFKNTGIIDSLGNVYLQVLEDVWFYFLSRYALSGESVLGYNQGWGAWSSIWGVNTVNHVIGTNPLAPDFNMRGCYSWYGPHSQRPLPYEGDWGCPNQREDGVMSSAKYVGCVTLHCDRNSYDSSDDVNQPMTTAHHSSDDEITVASSQYDEIFMQERYDMMSSGHPEMTHAEEVGDNYAEDHPMNSGGGVSQGQGYGPYTLEPGDSIRIVFAEGVAGISRQKNREVGVNWLEYYNGTSTPALILPDGSATTDYNAYKRAWVQTGLDSIRQTYLNALNNFQSGFNIPHPPPPPDAFTVQSGSDRIVLTWSDNATAWPGFDGYVIYRTEGNVGNPATVYQKIFQCNAANAVHQFEDTTVLPGYDNYYYYYIQSKDDGSANDVEPGEPLASSLFWTLTNVPAYLLETRVKESNKTSPLSFRLDQNYPNPFNPSTTIRFSLPKAGHVTLKVFDLLGKEMETIFDGHCSAGENKITWQPKELSSGVYMYHLQAGDIVNKMKMIFLK